MGIFNGGSFPTSGGTTIISQDGDQTLTLVGSILTISGTNSSVDLSGFLDDTNTTNTSLVLGVDNVLTLTDSASNTVTADLSSLLDDTNTTNTTLVLNGNILELTDSDANTITADLSGLTPATPTLQEVTDAGYLTTNDITIKGTDNILRLETDSDVGNKRLDLFVGADGVGRIESNQSAQQLAFGTVNTERMRITSTGNVGIGTSSPSAKLHVGTGSGATASSAYQIAIDGSAITGLQILSGNTQSGRIVFGDAEDNDIGMILYDHSNDSLRTFVNAAERMRIDSSGNVGIGTTSPSLPLHILGNNNLQEWDGNNIYSVLGLQSADNYPALVFKDYTTGNGVGFIRSNNSNYLQIATSGTKDIVLDSGGNIGINKTSPDAKLHIVGSGNTSGTTALLVENSDGTDLLKVTDDGAFYTKALFTTASGVTQWGTNGTAYGGLTWATGYATVYAVGGNELRLGSNGSSPDATILTSGQLQLNNYTSTTFDGTPTSFLGVDASGNVIKTSSVLTSTPTLQEVTDEGNTTTNGISIGQSNTPNNKLEVYNGGTSGNIASFKSGATTSGDYAGITLHSSTVSGNDWYGSELRSINTSSSPGSLNPRLGFFTQDNNTYLPADRTEKMSILGNGSVGIGTTSPSAKLQILGAAQGDEVLRLGTAVTDRGLKVTTFAAGSQGNAGVNFDAFWATDAALSFSTKGTEALYIDGSQNIGINKTSPSAKLHIVGGAAAGGGTALLVENTEGDDLLKVDDNGGATINDKIFINSVGELGLGGSPTNNYAIHNQNAKDVSIAPLGQSLRFGSSITFTRTTTTLTHQSSSGGHIFKTFRDGSTQESFHLKGDGQLKLTTYTSANFNGTLTAVLGVDASGNVIKTTSLTTPTLQQVIDAGGTYSGTDDNVSFVCGGEGEFSASSNITTIASTGGITSISGAGVNIGGSSTINLNPTAGGVSIIPSVGDVNIDPVDGDINLTPPSGHKIFLGGTNAKVQIPTWATSSNRPTVSGAGDAGTIGYNIADAALELWNGSAWVTI